MALFIESMKQKINIFAKSKCPKGKYSFGEWIIIRITVTLSLFSLKIHNRSVIFITNRQIMLYTKFMVIKSPDKMIIIAIARFYIFIPNPRFVRFRNSKRFKYTRKITHILYFNNSFTRKGGNIRAILGNI